MCRSNLNKNSGNIIDFVMILFLINSDMNNIERVISYLVIVPFLVQALNVKSQNTQQSIKNNKNPNDSGIFNIRWRLGDAFNPQQTQRNNQYYVLQFDSKTSINAQTYVQFKNKVFSCSEQQDNSQNIITYFHTCRVNEAPAFPYEYQIVRKVISFNGTGEQTQIQQRLQTILFKGILDLQNIGESTDQQSSKDQYSNQKDQTEVFQKIIIAIQYIVIISLLAFMLITFITIRKKSSPSKESQQKHVQLVEQIVAGSSLPK